MEKTPGSPPLKAGPAVWVGPQWQGRVDWIVRLEGSDLEEIEAAAAAWPRHAHGLAGPLQASDFPLTNLGPRLAAMRDELEHGRGFSMIKGLPVKRWRRTASIFAGLGLLAHLGRMAEAQPACGPMQRPAGCDAVGLLCLSELRPVGPVRLASVGAVFQRMRAEYPEQAALLCRPLPVSSVASPGWALAPMFVRELGEVVSPVWRAAIDQAQAELLAPRLSAAQQEALATYDRLAAQAGVGLALRLDPGDLLCAHTRRLRVDHDPLDHEPAASDHGPLLRRHLALADVVYLD